MNARIKRLLEDMQGQWQLLGQRIASFDEEFAAMACTAPAARRLATIPGIGVPNATALAAASGTGETLGHRWDLGAWPRLMPRQATIGSKPKPLGTTKRGTGYPSKLLIRTTRAAIGPSPS